MPFWMLTPVGQWNHVLHGVDVKGQFWKRKGAGPGHARAFPVVDILEVTRRRRSSSTSTVRIPIGVYYMGFTLAQPGEYGWADRLRRRCGLMPYCFHHLLLWPPYVIGQAIIFLPRGFFYLLFSSPNLSGHRLDVYYTSTHGVALVRI